MLTTVLQYSPTNILKNGIVLRSNLESFNERLIENKLSLHTGKTELIIFGSKRKLNNVSILLQDEMKQTSKENVAEVGFEPTACGLSMVLK